jgi:hypothetical protein
MQQIEKDKFQERLDFAIELLSDKFPNLTPSELIKESCEIARTLYVRSEIAFTSKK